MENIRKLLLNKTMEQLSDEAWHHTQIVRKKERTHLDMLLQCASHFSEHMGQILYIGKMIKEEQYEMTSIPLKRQATR